MMFDNSSGKGVRQGHVPETETLYFRNCKHDVKKRLRGTVPEGVFFVVVYFEESTEENRKCQHL